MNHETHLKHCMLISYVQGMFYVGEVDRHIESMGPQRNLGGGVDFNQKNCTGIVPQLFSLLTFSPLYSLRVNLDMGKIVYSWMIRKDSKIPGTVVRSSTIPEQLGRISYLLTDKTGMLERDLFFIY